MSAESAKAFLKKMSDDADLRAKVEAADSDSARYEIAKANGFEFTKDEMKQAMHQGLKSKGALSDEDLEAVAGGTSGTWVGVGVGAAALGA